MAITMVDSRDDLNNLVNEHGVHSVSEEVENSEVEDVRLNEGEKNLQEVYDALLEDCGKYAMVANNAVKKMKMCVLTKARRTFKKCMMHCLKIVANMTKLQRMRLER